MHVAMVCSPVWHRTGAALAVTRRANAGCVRGSCAKERLMISSTMLYNMHAVPQIAYRHTPNFTGWQIGFWVALERIRPVASPALEH